MNKRNWLVLGALALACSDTSDPGVPELVDCSVFPQRQAATYVLPYAVGESYLVTRTFGHYLASNGGVGLYAIDFLMPIGTNVHAMRSGVVAAVEERFTDDDKTQLHENWVMIRHADGTIGRYIHLTENGALVNVGETVQRGQVIARSGNSGPSTAPHLHVDVQTCGPNLPPGYNDLPCGMTLPVTFLNTAAHTCGLEPRQTYTALPFASEDAQLSSFRQDAY